MEGIAQQTKPSPNPPIPTNQGQFTHAPDCQRTNRARMRAMMGNPTIQLFAKTRHSLWLGRQFTSANGLIIEPHCYPRFLFPPILDSSIQPKSVQMSLPLLGRCGELLPLQKNAVFQDEH